METNYKQGDFVEFTTRQPEVHIQEMFGYGQVPLEDIQETYHIGKVKSVIGNGKAYLITSLSPVSGFFCVEDASKIIRLLNDDEISEEMRNHQDSPLYMAPNVYINHNELKGSIAKKCKQVAREAMASLFPNDEIVSAEFIVSDFLLGDIIAQLDSLFHSFYQKDCAKSQEELELLKSQTAQQIKQMRFKEYYSVNIGIIDDSVDCDSTFSALLKKLGFKSLPKNFYKTYYLVAIDLNFEGVSIMRNISERSSFFRSLGPEFDYAHTLFRRFRDAIFQKKNDDNK